MRYNTLDLLPGVEPRSEEESQADASSSTSDQSSRGKTAKQVNRQALQLAQINMLLVTMYSLGAC